MITAPLEPADLGATDGRVARAQRALSAALAALATDEGRERAREDSPFDGVREVTGQTLFRALRALEIGPALVPHRDALLRWVHELLQSRIGWDLIVDEAEAEHAIDAALPQRAANDDELAIAKSFLEARDALVEAPQVEAVAIALRRLAELAPPIAAVRSELRGRRFEAARRLGLEHPWALAVARAVEPPKASSPEAPPPDGLIVVAAAAAPSEATPLGGDVRGLEALARAVLDATEPLAVEVHKGAARRAGISLGPALVIHEAFARDAREGWPARLGARWLEDVFRVAAPRPPRLGHLPAAVSGASFLRAAAAWGAALRREGVARTLPFALARDPYPDAAFALGATFAIAVASEVFARRKLGLSARGADAHARSLARPLLHELRARSAQVIAGMKASAGSDVDELTARVFGAPLPPALAAAWSSGGLSGATRVDAPARLLGAVRSRAMFDDLVARFDEDWFDNPRVAAHLAATAAGPVWSGELPGDGEVDAIARALERVLG